MPVRMLPFDLNFNVVNGGFGCIFRWSGVRRMHAWRACRKNGHFILFQPLSGNRSDQPCLRCAYDRCRTTLDCGTGTTTRQRDRKISAEFFSNTMHDGHSVHDMALRVFCYPSAQTLLQTKSSTLCGANPGHVRDLTGTGCPH